MFAPTDIRAQYRGIVVAVGGPPHSGKSVFIAELYRQLLQRRPTGTFRQATNPDGEGMWAAEADPELVKRLRKKDRYSPEFVSFICDSVRNLGQAMERVLLDLGGKPLPPNDQLLGLSTHLIVVSRDEQEAAAWRAYGEAFECRTLAVIRSRLFQTSPGVVDELKRTPDQSWEGEPPLSGEIWQLDRSGPRDLYQDSVGRISEWLLSRNLAVGHND